jgi:uncharacterized protein YndB with AHSA1/START domain
MERTHQTIKKTININAPASDVWKALTDPEIVRRYFFGTDVDSDWKAGSPITYSGLWEGRAYKDKGKIIEIEEEKKLRHTHWSSLSGLSDAPENYFTVMYELKPNGNRTSLTVTQSGNMTDESARHSGSNWQNVLEKMKGLLEEQPVHK